jgi:hypothetical protein
MGEDCDQRVEQLRLPDRLREIRGEKRSSAPASPPAEGAERHERQRRAAFADLARSATPSISGMCMSTIARSNASPVSSQPSASFGDSLARDAMPHFAVCTSSTRRLVALSSTTSRCLPSSPGCTPTNCAAALAGTR